MITSRFKTTPEWREFEKLVVRIEETIETKGAVIRSPDRIRSLITNRPREVDASIRTKIGSTEILVTVECRRRKGKQDVTWLEQLACKKQAIGAARTIAVSASEFSSGAVQAAKQYGIDLRILRDITDDDIRSWPFPTSFFHIHKHAELLSPPNLELETPQSESTDNIEELREIGINDKVFRNSADEPWSLNDIWIHAQPQVHTLYEQITQIGEKRHFRIRLNFTEDILFMTSEAPQIVKAVTFHCALSWQREDISSSDAKLVEYATAGDSATAPIARVEFETKSAQSTNFRVGFQFEKDNNETMSVQLERLKDIEI